MDVEWPTDLIPFDTYVAFCRCAVHNNTATPDQRVIVYMAEVMENLASDLRYAEGVLDGRKRARIEQMEYEKKQIAATQDLMKASQMAPPMYVTEETARKIFKV